MGKSVLELPASISELEKLAFRYLENLGGSASLIDETKNYLEKVDKMVTTSFEEAY